MSASTEGGGAEYRTLGVGAADLERYDAVTLEDGEVVIYDRDDEDAWVQSAVGVDLEIMR